MTGRMHGDEGMAADLVAVESRLWAAADQLWANTGLRPSDFSEPVLGLIFLRYADKRFAEVHAKLLKQGFDADELDESDYQAEGVVYLPERARFSALLALTEGDNVGKALNETMLLIEGGNPELKGVMPRSYNKLPNGALVELLRLLAPLDLSGDAFGKVYEFFLGSFARAEGSKGGVFYTPESIVRLIVEIIEPFHGRIFDPACGSGGMFVQSAHFVERHNANPTSELTVFGTEKDAKTVKLAKMNLAVHGLSGDIREANSYYDDPHKALGRFDFVMANPPFNVSGVDKDRLKDDKRFALGLPSNDNGNYLWIQLFHSVLNEKGRAGFVMANSAGDARGSELDIRRRLIESGDVDAVVSIGSNFFYTVALPCTLWFLDKGKPTNRKKQILFIDARAVYRQVTRAIREFAPEQREFLVNIARLYRGEAPEFETESKGMLKKNFPSLAYADVAGLCRVVGIGEIEEQGWSLNPGRYVGVGARAPDEFDFAERLEELNEELELLNSESRVLEERIAANVAGLLGDGGA
jgi:type I restriction enzyme M protein